MVFSSSFRGRQGSKWGADTGHSHEERLLPGLWKQGSNHTNMELYQRQEWVRDKQWQGVGQLLNCSLCVLKAWGMYFKLQIHRTPLSVWEFCCVRSSDPSWLLCRCDDSEAATHQEERWSRGSGGQGAHLADCPLACCPSHWDCVQWLWVRGALSSLGTSSSCTFICSHWRKCWIEKTTPSSFLSSVTGENRPRVRVQTLRKLLFVP